MTAVRPRDPSSAGNQADVSKKECKETLRILQIEPVKLRRRGRTARPLARGDLPVGTGDPDRSDVRGGL